MDDRNSARPARYPTQARRLFRSASLALLATAALPSHAQAAMSTTVPGGATDPGEIIVTAQKKSENIQSVPLTVRAVSSQTLTNLGAKQLGDYAATIPGLQVDTGGAPGLQTITIRGISTGNLYGSSTTAVYVDDVPIGSSSAYAYGGNFGLDVLPYDLSRVEVLEGPQGTLYGASSMGGLLKYVLTTPSLSTDSVRIGGDLSGIAHGSGLGTSERGYANVVISQDRLAVSLSGSHSYVPGFITNAANGQKGINDGTQNGVRGALLWHPADRLSINLGILYNASNFHDVAQISVNPDGTPIYGNLSERGLSSRPLATRTFLYSGTINYDLGIAKLTSVTGYSNVRNKETITFANPFFASLNVSPYFHDLLPVKKFTQELRIASPSEHTKFQWTVGGFYTHENAQVNETGLPFDATTGQVNSAFYPLDSISEQSKFAEKAVFANASYETLPHWDISAGIRYSHNDQSVDTKGTGPGGTLGFLYGGATDTPTYKSSESVTTYSATSRYHFTKDIMAYVRVATGYRPGGSNAGVAGAPPTFAADKLTNYEGGIKSELFDRHLLLDADIFYIDWKDIQLGSNTSSNLLFTGNAGRAKSKGFELTTNVIVSPEIQLGGTVVYNDAKLSTDAPAVGGTAGDRLPLSAKWTASMTADWSHSVGPDRKISANAIWRYVGDRFADFPAGANPLHIPDYTALDLGLGFSTKHWSARIFARNVTDKTTYLRYYQGYATVLQPRTIGLSLDLNY
jgi:iron complex outermembrane receptor protein